MVLWLENLLSGNSLYFYCTVIITRFFEKSNTHTSIAFLLTVHSSTCVSCIFIFMFVYLCTSNSLVEEDPFCLSRISDAITDLSVSSKVYESSSCLCLRGQNTFCNLLTHGMYQTKEVVCISYF